MPVVKIDYCDECEKELDEESKYLIYEVNYWNKKKYIPQTWKFIDYAAMFCSEECMGKWLGKLIDGEEIEQGFIIDGLV